MEIFVMTGKLIGSLANLLNICQTKKEIKTTLTTANVASKILQKEHPNKLELVNCGLQDLIQNNKFNDENLATILNSFTKKQANGKKDPFAAVVAFSLLQIGKVRNPHSHGQIKIEGPLINQIQSRLIVNAAHTIAIFILETWQKQKDSKNI